LRSIPIASRIAAFPVLYRNTVNRYLQGIRGSLSEYCTSRPAFSAEIEVVESCFGTKGIVPTSAH
jgi:hypothetical protein